MIQIRNHQWMDNLPVYVVIFKFNNGIPNMVLGFTEAERVIAYNTFWLPQGLPTVEVSIWHDLTRIGVRRFQPAKKTFAPVSLVPFLQVS